MQQQFDAISALPFQSQQWPMQQQQQQQQQQTPQQQSMQQQGTMTQQPMQQQPIPPNQSPSFGNASMQQQQFGATPNAAASMNGGGGGAMVIVRQQAGHQYGNVGMQGMGMQQGNATNVQNPFELHQQQQAPAQQHFANAGQQQFHYSPSMSLGSPSMTASNPTEHHQAQQNQYYATQSSAESVPVMPYTNNFFNSNASVGGAGSIADQDDQSIASMPMTPSFAMNHTTMVSSSGGSVGGNVVPSTQDSRLQLAMASQSLTQNPFQSLPAQHQQHHMVERSNSFAGVGTPMDQQHQQQQQLSYQQQQQQQISFQQQQELAKKKQQQQAENQRQAQLMQQQQQQQKQQQISSNAALQEANRKNDAAQQSEAAAPRSQPKQRKHRSQKEMSNRNHDLAQRAKLSSVLASHAPHNASTLPDISQVLTRGYILSRISFRTILFKKWKQTYWAQYGQTQLLMFRSLGDFDDWATNPYHTQAQRDFLVKLKVDFVNDAMKPNVVGYQITQPSTKSYGAKEPLMRQFKLERWMDYGPTIVSCFASANAREVENLRQVIVNMLRYVQRMKNAAQNGNVVATRGGNQFKYPTDDGRRGSGPGGADAVSSVSRNNGNKNVVTPVIGVQRMQQQQQRRQILPPQPENVAPVPAAPAPLIDLLE